MKHFFFLPDDHMPQVFSAIARLIYHSNGGFSFQELYQGMPVYVRRYMTGEIQDIKKKEKEAIEEGKSGGSGQAPPEDIGKAMEQLEKDSEGQGLDEEDFKQVFGDKDEQKKANTPGGKSPREQRQPDQQSTKDKPETSDDADPAKAEDLEQMLDVLGDN
jgi:hypothetical protein